MSKYKDLTDYISLLHADDFGEWIIDEKNDGTQEHPKKFPFLIYSKTIDDFINDFYSFIETNQDMALNGYQEILQDNGIKWNKESMSNADVSNLDSQCVLALIMGAIRADRFSDGALLYFFNSGCISRWLLRLQEFRNG